MKKKIYYYFSVCDQLFADISTYLSENLTDLEFSGYAYGRSKGLSTYKFSHISYFSDIEWRKKQTPIEYSFLRRIEKELDFTLSECINAERNFSVYPSDKRYYIAQEMLKQIYGDMTAISPELIVLEGLDDFASLFLYHYGRAMNIPVVYYVYARLGSYLIRSDRLDTGPRGFNTDIANITIDENQLNHTKAFIDYYVKNKSQPSYVSDKTSLYKIVSRDDLRKISKGLSNYRFDKKRFGRDSHPFLFPLKRLRRIKNTRDYHNYLKNRFVPEKNLASSKYLIYPLHFHPEAATLVQGRWFNDQYRLTEMISKALPADHVLIVKEHKVSIGRRPITFYKQIDQLHNVHFIHETTDVYDLIENSLGVCTISSSMGLEALMLNTPVMVFGDIFYKYCPGVIHSTDFSKINRDIEALLKVKIINENVVKLIFEFRKNIIKVSPGFSAHKYDNTSMTAIATDIMTLLLS